MYMYVDWKGEWKVKSVNKQLKFIYSLHYNLNIEVWTLKEMKSSHNKACLGQTKKCVFPVTCFLKLGQVPVGRIIFWNNFICLKHFL